MALPFQTPGGANRMKVVPGDCCRGRHPLGPCLPQPSHLHTRPRTPRRPHRHAAATPRRAAHPPTLPAEQVITKVSNQRQRQPSKLSLSKSKHSHLKERSNARWVGGESGSGRSPATATAACCGDGSRSVAALQRRDANASSTPRLKRS